MTLEQETPSVYALAIEVVTDSAELSPEAIAQASFAQLPDGVIQDLAFRGWKGEIRRILQNQRNPSGKTRPGSPAWDAVGEAHRDGNLDLARWCVDGKWTAARDLTVWQVGELIDYYEKQAQSNEQMRERFVKLRAAMKRKKAEVASGIGDDKLEEILFND